MVKLKWYVVNNEYVEYLKKYDKLVQNNYALKPYIGIVFEIKNFKYYAPISSTKEKYQKFNEGKDIIKILDNGVLLGVINLNNMIPIKQEVIDVLNFSNIEKYRSFKNKLDKNKYISLLNKELSLINKKREEIYSKSNFLYNEKIKNPNSKISQRCCNFSLLEKKCLEYEIKSNYIES